MLKKLLIIVFIACLAVLAVRLPLDDFVRSQRAEAYLQMGEWQALHSNYRLAQQNLDKALALRRAPDTLARVGLIWYGTGKFKEALPYLQQAAGMQSKPPWALQVALAVSLEASGAKEQTTTLLQQVMKQMPNDAFCLNNIAYPMADQGILLPEAILMLERAVYLAPKEPYILDSLGWAYYRQGRLAEAYNLLTRANANTKDAEIANHLRQIRESLFGNADAGEV
jgi:tetratricopeptide (TPR) repeat protein